MIVDTSAIVAIICGGSEAQHFSDVIAAAPVCRMSAATMVELATLIDKQKSPSLSGELEDLIAVSNIQIAPLTPSQAMHARIGHQKYGKGMGHRAQLNFGDCFSYALAKDLDEPLLFKGDDFGHTDIRDASKL